MKQLLLVLLLICGAVGIAQAQRNISGSVSDPTGEPLIGASIVAKGTTTGTVTDEGGKFTLSLPAATTSLMVSMIGYETQELAISASNVYNISLVEGANTMSEVVVTGIGIQRDKKALGYAVSNVDGTDLQGRSEVDPLRALTGKVPGVQITGGGGAPGMSTKINIRGQSSMTGNTQPLFVVDGIPFDNSVNGTTGSAGGSQFSNRAFDIDPNNIQSMTILKGAAAAALYGSRATNGVVVITTKNGAKARKGLEVTYSTSANWEKIASLPDYQDKYGQGSNNIYNGGFIGNWGAPFSGSVKDINAQYGTDYAELDSVPHPLVSTTYAAPRYSDVFPEYFQKDADGEFILNAAGNKVPVNVPYRNYNFIPEFFNTGTVLEHAISINSGGPTGGISATMSTMKNKGIVPNAGSGRTSLGLGANSKLANGLIVSGSMNYVNTTQYNPPINGSIFESGWYGGAEEGSIFARLFYLPRSYNLIDYPSTNPVNGSNVFYRALDNPLWLAENNKYTSDVNRVYGNMALSYDVNSWLNLTARGGVNSYHDSRRNTSRPGGSADPDGSIWTDDVDNREIDYNFIATITKDISRDVDFRLVAGLNLNERKFSSRFVFGDQVIDPNLFLLDATAVQLVRDDRSRLQRLNAVYADAQFGIKDALYFGLVVRNDKTSTLPEGNNSFAYGGANMSWIFTDWFEMRSKVLDYGKFRISYAQVGNEARPYQTSTTYTINPAFDNGSSTYIASLDNTLGNPNLRNELTGEFETGTDLRFFGNRVGLEATFYNRRSSDQITYAALPASTGFTGQIVNAGTIQNRGWEIGLDLVPFKTKNFTWNSFINFTRNRSLIVDAGPSGEIVFGGPASSLGVIHRTGEQYGQIYGTSIARHNGQMMIDPVLGLTVLNQTSDIIGNPNPDFLLGWINTFTIKNFSIRVLADTRQGGDMFSITTGALLARGHLISTEDREALRVIPGILADPATLQPLLDESGNTIQNTIPVTAFEYHFSNGFGPYGADETNVYDATTYRLREITIGYTIPKTSLKGTPFGSMRFSFSGRNLWFISPNFAKGINLDPEVLAETADSNVQGFEYGSYPNTRRYGVNFSVTF
jgi:TonB-linked SusC/RagA family outer membrane protein